MVPFWVCLLTSSVFKLISYNFMICIKNAKAKHDCVEKAELEDNFGTNSSFVSNSIKRVHAVILQSIFIVEVLLGSKLDEVYGLWTSLPRLQDFSWIDIQTQPPHEDSRGWKQT